MYVRVESGLGAATASDPLSTILGGIFSGAGSITGGFLTADATKYAASQQAKTDMFSVMAQQNVGIEQIQASERIAATAQQASVQQTAIITQALTTGIIAAALVGGVWVIAKAFTGN